MTRTRILILGGTGDGFRLAGRLASVSGVDGISSMAGVTEAPKVPDGLLRRGGFGGAYGLARYLKAERIAAVVDATHPFASGMSRNASLACGAEGVPVVHIWRPGWTPVAGDRWTMVADMTAAAAAIPSNARGVFLTTGKTQLHHFSTRDDVTFVARTVGPLRAEDATNELPSNLTFVHDRGPFDLEGELALLRAHGITLIVTKNSGGTAASSKLEAARMLDIPVIMVDRPDAPDGPCVADADAALRWLGDVRPEVGVALFEDVGK